MDFRHLKRCACAANVGFHSRPINSGFVAPTIKRKKQQRNSNNNNKKPSCASTRNRKNCRLLRRGAQFVSSAMTRNGSSCRLLCMGGRWCRAVLHTSACDFWSLSCFCFVCDTTLLEHRTVQCMSVHPCDLVEIFREGCGGT